MTKTPHLFGFNDIGDSKPTHKKRLQKRYSGYKTAEYHLKKNGHVVIALLHSWNYGDAYNQAC